MLIRKENKIIVAESFPSIQDPVKNWYKVDVEIPTEWLDDVITNKDKIRIKSLALNSKKNRIVVLDKGDYKNTIRGRFENAFLDKVGLSWEDLK